MKKNSPRLLTQNNLQLWLTPFLLAIFPTLVIYVHNITQLSLSRMLIPIFYSLVLTLVSSCVAYVLFKRAEKASIFTSYWILLVFSYGYVYIYLGNIPFFVSLPLSLNKVLLGIFLASLLLVWWVLSRISTSLDKLVSFLLVISCSLVIFNVVKIVPFEISRVWGAAKLQQYTTANFGIEESESDVSFQPDIYYVVFDRYARQDVLKNYFNFDNQAQVDYLKRQNFLVGEQSFANYPNTFLSLSSSLNMTYLDFLPQVLGESQADRVPVFGGLIEKNRVAAYLQNKGYKYVLSGSYWDPTKVTGIADENDNLFSDFDEFHLYIYERTLFNTLRGIIEDKQLYTGAERLNKMSLNLDYRLSQIKKQTPETQPLFVFAHFLMPHEPNVRSETCEPLTLDEIRAQTTEQGYLKETACANEIMKALTEKIKARPDRPAVIIFQSDEGPYLPSSYFNKNGQLVPAEKDSYLIHGAVLNALYLPDKNNPQLSANYEQLGLHQASSPVNTFRAIFNYYFGAQLPLLEDKLYFSNNDERYPYQYFEVIP